MLENIRCSYCQYWPGAKIERRSEGEDQGKKKKKKKKKYEIVTKICKIGSKEKKVNSDSAACHYFNPKDLFYCEENNCFLNLVNCLHRRRNNKDFKAWESCKKCRQYEKGIRDIIEDYYFNNTEIIKPKEPRKIKRRKKADAPTSRRIIKRRKPKRIIKRRKPKRIIKRRKPTKIKRRKR